MAPQRPGKQSDLVAEASLLQNTQLTRDSIERRVPLDGGECARAALCRPFHRALQAVRVILFLDTGLAARTQFAAVDGVSGVALGLLGPALDDPHEHAAAGSALAARCGVEVLVGSQQVFSQAHPTLSLKLVSGGHTAGESHGPERRRRSGGQELAARRFGPVSLHAALSV